MKADDGQNKTPLRNRNRTVLLVVGCAKANLIMAFDRFQMIWLTVDSVFTRNLLYVLFVYVRQLPL